MICSNPKFNAAVVVECRDIPTGGFVVLYDFLAQGNSQKRKGGKVIGYTKRNPDRRALFNSIFERIPGGCKFTVIGGKGGQISTVRWCVVEDIKKAYRSGFRFSVFVECPESYRPSIFEGLEVVKHRPVNTEKIWGAFHACL